MNLINKYFDSTKHQKLIQFLSQDRLGKFFFQKFPIHVFLKKEQQNIVELTIKNICRNLISYCRNFSKFNSPNILFAPTLSSSSLSIRQESKMEFEDEFPLSIPQKSRSPSLSLLISLIKTSLTSIKLC